MKIMSRYKFNISEYKITNYFLYIIIPFITVPSLICFWQYIQAIDIFLFFFMALSTHIGISMGYHRYFTHNSFKCSRWLRYFLVILGNMGGVGSTRGWVKTHRLHHHFADGPGDPHSPFLLAISWGKCRRLWHSFIGWMFVDDCFLYSLQQGPLQKNINLQINYQHMIPDLDEDRILVKIDSFYEVWVLLGFLIPGIVAGFWTESGTGAWMGILWGGFFRFIVVAAVTTGVGFCHLYGKKTFKTNDNSRDNWFIALISLGEGWHNSHHRFPGSARHGLQWWQIDLIYYIIFALNKFGIIWDIRLPQSEPYSKSQEKFTDL